MGVSFEAAYSRRPTVGLDSIDIPAISREDLIANSAQTAGHQILRILSDWRRKQSVRVRPI
jgi:hypothetical protein